MFSPKFIFDRGRMSDKAKRENRLCMSICIIFFMVLPMMFYGCDMHNLRDTMSFGAYMKIWMSIVFPIGVCYILYCGGIIGKHSGLIVCDKYIQEGKWKHTWDEIRRLRLANIILEGEKCPVLLMELTHKPNKTDVPVCVKDPKTIAPMDPKNTIEYMLAGFPRSTQDRIISAISMYKHMDDPVKQDIFIC